MQASTVPLDYTLETSLNQGADIKLADISALSVPEILIQVKSTLDEGCLRSDNLGIIGATIPVTYSDFKKNM